jgi:hypothetical protein
MRKLMDCNECKDMDEATYMIKLRDARIAELERTLEGHQRDTAVTAAGWRKRTAVLERDLATRKADEAAAAGSLSVAIPERGTDAARLLVLVTNLLLQEDDLKRDLVEAKANAGAWCQQAKENAMEIDRLLGKIREVERDVERLRGHVSELRELAEFLSCETSGQYEARDEVMRKTKP